MPTFYLLTKVQLWLLCSNLGNEDRDGEFLAELLYSSIHILVNGEHQSFRWISQEPHKFVPVSPVCTVLVNYPNIANRPTGPQYCYKVVFIRFRFLL